MTTIKSNHSIHEIGIGQTIFDCADKMGMEIPTSCQRNGKCHECIVEITRGMSSLSPKSKFESFLRENFRLACQAEIISKIEAVEFSPLRRRPKILTSINTGLEKKYFDPNVRKVNGRVLREFDDLGPFKKFILGMVIDLGTTTVVIDFIDLLNGKSIYTSSFENPQRFGGSDIMHRISYDKDDHRGELQKAICAAINQEIIAGCKLLKISRHNIYEIVVAGNTTMRDIFFKIDVQTIGQKPYKSIIENEFDNGIRSGTALLESARKIGLLANPKAIIYGLPLVSCHVGGDLAAGILSLDNSLSGSDTVMLVDMGTNTEVFLKHRDRMVVASCPAGPAFEGGLIKYGMPAYDGAVQKFSIGKDINDVSFDTIGNIEPQGFCGSGLIDLLSEFRNYEVMTEKGVFTADKKMFEHIIFPKQGITFSKEDASNLGQAKAANYCGQVIVMRKLGVNPSDIDRLFLSGGFAHHINVDSAINIGLLIPVKREKIVQIGNTSLSGAREVLLSLSKRRALEQLVKNIEHVELETTPDFFELFVDGCQFKPIPSKIS